MAFYHFSFDRHFLGSEHYFFAGAAIIVLEVALGSVIAKDVFSRLLYTFFVLAVDSFLLAILTLK